MRLFYALGFAEHGSRMAPHANCKKQTAGSQSADFLYDDDGLPK
jgi:hypothetical protein